MLTVSALLLSITMPTPCWTGRPALRYLLPSPGQGSAMQRNRSQSGLAPNAAVSQPPGGGSIQMTTDAVAGQAIVAGGHRLENPQVSVLDGDDIGPTRQRLPGAGPVTAEQLDDDPEEQVQQGVSGQLCQPDVEPEFLDCGLAHFVSGLEVGAERGPVGIEEGRHLGFAAPLDDFVDVVDLDGVPDAA